MKHFDRSAFVNFLVANRVVGFFDEPVKLKSGRMSNWYVNWRTISSDVFLMDQLSDHLISFILSPDLNLNLNPNLNLNLNLNLKSASVLNSFYGVPEGATKLGLIATFKWAKMQKDFAAGNYALPMGRGKVKEHGAPQDKFFVGQPRGNIIVVEDVTTTGSSLVETLKQLSQIDVKVIAAIGLTNRMEVRDDGKSVEAVIAEHGVKYLSLSDATDFLPAAFKAFAPGEKIGRAIEAEFAKYGVKPIKL